MADLKPSGKDIFLSIPRQSLGMDKISLPSGLRSAYLTFPLGIDTIYLTEFHICNVIGLYSRHRSMILRYHSIGRPLYSSVYDHGDLVQVPSEYRRLLNHLVPTSNILRDFHLIHRSKNQLKCKYDRIDKM